MHDIYKITGCPKQEIRAFGWDSVTRSVLYIYIFPIFQGVIKTQDISILGWDSVTRSVLYIYIFPIFQGVLNRL